KFTASSTIGDSTIFDNGQIGIGTTAPATKLTVLGSETNTTVGGGAAAALKIVNTDVSAGGRLAELQFGDSATSLYAAISGSITDASNNTLGDMFFSTRNVSTDASLISRMVIKQSGNVGIGTTAPSAKLEVAADNNFKVSSIIGNSAGALLDMSLQNSAGTTYVQVGKNGAGSGWDNLFRIGASNNTILDVSGGGISITATANTGGVKLTNGATTWVSNSDQRLKTNIQPLPTLSGLAAIRELSPALFNWRDSLQNAVVGPQMGFIAQDVEKIFPGLVVETGSTTITLSDGTKTTIPNTKALNYTGLISPLVKAVQELDTTLTLQGQQVSSVAANLIAVVATQSADVTNIAANTQAITDLQNGPASSSAVLSLSTQVSSLSGNLSSLKSQADSNTNQISTLANSLSTLTDLVNLLASGSASLNASGSAKFVSFDSLGIKNATISGTLNVLGRTTLNDLGVTGSITAGLLSIDGLSGSIDAIGQPLKLQSLGTGSLDLFAGKVTVDNVGNIKTVGNVTASTVNTDKLNISTTTSATGSAVLSASAGVVTLPARGTSIDVNTSALTANSLIFTTPDSPVALGTKKMSTTTFRITVQTPAVSDVKVNWWIVMNKSRYISEL
ncbi:MAG: tail fiber domain-containing protein, partial [Nitrospiria bacterium]